MTIPDPATTDWVPVWNPQSAGPIGPQGPAGVPSYEEGVWTPFFRTDQGTVSGQVYGTRVGQYIKIGKQVHINFDITITNPGTAISGSLAVSGLPFVPVNNSNTYFTGSLSYFSNLTTPVNSVWLYLPGGQTEIYFQYKNSLSGSMTDQLLYAVAANSRMMGAITYFVP